jgi:hypothetical protein
MNARVVVAAGLTAVLGVGIGVAHASTLGVAGSGPSVTTAQACTAGTVALSAQPGGLWSLLFGYTEVGLTVPAACAGADLSVTIYATQGGAALASASASGVAAGAITLTTSATYGGVLTGRPAYSGTLTFDGWSVPATF